MPVYLLVYMIKEMYYYDIFTNFLEDWFYGWGELMKKLNNKNI